MVVTIENHSEVSCVHLRKSSTSLTNMTDRHHLACKLLTNNIDGEPRAHPHTLEDSAGGPAFFCRTSCLTAHGTN
jgi:hypothetical protein